MAFGAPSLRGRALRYLSQREHSRAELARKLRRRTVGKSTETAGATNAGNVRNIGDVGDTSDSSDSSDSSETSDAYHAGEDSAASDVGTLSACIEAALDELVAHGLLSDERAAASVLNAQAPRSGERRLKQVLQSKGLAPELIADTLAQVRGTEFERALALWQRRFGSQAHDATERARQMRFLQGRGFGFDVIARVLRAAGTPPDEASD